MRKIRVGIIGQGRSGYGIHAHTLGLMPEKYDVIAVCDPIEELCIDARESLGSEVHSDHRRLLERDDLDLVVNATPSHLHVPITMEALDAGHSVLCEKPLARKASEVRELIAKADAKGVLLAAFQQSRFAPYFRQVKQVIDSGALGRIVMIKCAFNGFGRRWDWQTIQEFNGGNLLNTGPHPMDQVLQLLGTDVMPKVTCTMDRANTFGDAEDHVKILLQAPGRPTIDLEISSCCAYAPKTYQVYGTNGGLTGDMTHIDWKYFRPEEAPEQRLSRGPLPNRAWAAEELKWYTESWDVPESQADLFDYMGRCFYDDLYSALTEGTPLEVALSHVLRQIAVIEECHRQNPLPRI